MNRDHEAQDILKAHSLRRTSGRVRLLSFLLTATKPLSHSEIMTGLGVPRPDRVSVYRNLDTFVEHGIVHRAYVDDRTSLFETADRCGDTICHPHFVCRKCGSVRCLTGTTTHPVQDAPKGYHIERVQVHLRGLCPKCLE